MLLKKLANRVAGFFLVGIQVFQPLHGAGCDIDSTNLDRGEHKPFFICGEGITSDFVLRGPTEANVTVTYQQYMNRCAIEDNRPGVYLWLKGEPNAESINFQMLDSDGVHRLCEDNAIVVPERVVLPEAALRASEESGSDIHLLEIKAGKSQDLSSACENGLDFPSWGRAPSRWPVLSLVSISEMERLPRDFRSLEKPLTCSSSSITALVRVKGRQRHPAKIVISSVSADSGSAVEGVAYVMLPKPRWADSMLDGEAKFIDVEGIRTRYWEKGSGDALLLIHGGQPTGKAGGALTWAQNLDGLARDFRVFAVDRLGQGHTDNPTTASEYERYYEAVVEHVYGFIKVVGLDRVHLVGHSQGGWPVTRLALDHPDLVSCVVNVDSVMAPSAEFNRHTALFYLYSTQVHPPQGETLESLRLTRELQSHTLNNISDAGVRRGLQLTRLPKLVEASAVMAKLQMTPRNPSARALFDQARDEIANGDLQVPSLLIWGYNDPSSPYGGGLELFKLINAKTPISHLHVFNNSGHSSHVEHPEEFNRVISSFCGQY